MQGSTITLPKLCIIIGSDQHKPASDSSVLYGYDNIPNIPQTHVTLVKVPVNGFLMYWLPVQGSGSEPYPLGAAPIPRN